MTTASPVNAIVAYDRNRLIGAGGGLPWDIPADRHHFFRTTKGSALVMGRRTYEGLVRENPGREPLPHRMKFVVAPLADLRYVRNLGQIGIAVEHARNTDRPVWVIGGGRTYRDALDLGLVDRIVASEIHGVYVGDTYFPALGPEWNEVSRQAGTAFDIVEYRRN